MCDAAHGPLIGGIFTKMGERTIFVIAKLHQEDKTLDPSKKDM